MAEAHPSSRPEPRAWRPEDRRLPLARITALPTKRSDDPASSRADRSIEACHARVAKLDAEFGALREREARARLVLDSATDYAIVTMDADGRVTSWNAGAQNIMGYAEAEILGRSGDVVFTAELRRAAEMNHRLKNSFATVQAVATQTRRHAVTVAEFQAAFDARLAVLARANDVLIRADWHDAPLRDVIGSALDAYGGEPGRVTVGGPPVSLAASLAMTVSLAFHELATNAVKYGALSVSMGQVEVSWTSTPARTGGLGVHIIWREHGGPTVEPPQRRGFGSQLLKRGMPSGGTVTLDFQPEGLECRICLPLGGPTHQETSP